jgi:cyclopropane fatty-acyl-phospholipid synthase-like methyltransferase
LSTLDFERNAAFHDRLAAQSDSHLAAAPTNALARTAFRELVTRNVPAGATVLDFGCGTGLDALAYARSGYRVLAYDNSPGMVAQCQRRCAAEIASGTVTTYSMSYPVFSGRSRNGGPDLTP